MNVRVTALVILLSISVLTLVSVTSRATFTQNGVTIYNPPYPGYMYKSNQTIILNISAPAYPGGIVTVYVYSPSKIPVFTNNYELDSKGHLYTPLFTIPYAPQAKQSGFTNGTYTIALLIAQSVGVSIQVNIEILPVPGTSGTAIEVTVNSQIPYSINGTQMSGSQTFTYNSPVTITFPSIYTAQPGMVRYLVTGINVNGNIIKGNSVTLSQSGSYTVSPVFVVQYNVSFPFPIKVGVGGQNYTASWLWVNQGQAIVIYPQVVQIAPGVAYIISGQTVTVNSAGQVNPTHTINYQLNFTTPVNVTINGVTQVGKSFWVPTGSTVTVNPYIYVNSTYRIPVNVTSTTFQVDKPITISSSNGTPQYLIEIPYGNTVYPYWVSKGSSPPQAIPVSPYERLALVTPVTANGPISNVMKYYVIQYKVVINGNVTWVTRGSALNLSAGDNPLVAFFLPTYWQGNYSGPGPAQVLVYGPITENSYQTLDIFHTLLVVLAVIVIILVILLLRKPKPYATVVQQVQGSGGLQQPTQRAPQAQSQETVQTQPPAQPTVATPQPQPPAQIQPTQQVPPTQPQPYTQPPPPQGAVQPQATTPPQPSPQPTQQVPPLDVYQDKPGTLTQQGVATLTLVSNKPAVITSAVLLSNNAQAFNVPIQIAQGSNQIVLQFGAVQNFLRFVRYEIELTVVDPQLNLTKKLNVSVYGA
ncbi:MAG: DUF973 family protein [Thermoprotei archaeon]